MTTCKKINISKRKICSSDLKHRVEIQFRNIGAKEFSSPDYDELFTENITVWAALKTTRGFQSFGEVGITTNIQNNVTHLFYVRYSTSYSISADDWLLFKAERYDIKDVENLDERNDFILLYCIKKGTSSKLANST